MPVVEIKPDVYWIGVNDRTTDLFESLWPITREGVAYNSYLIVDEKRALVDTAKAFRASEFLHQVQTPAAPMLAVPAALALPAITSISVRS